MVAHSVLCALARRSWLNSTFSCSQSALQVRGGGAPHQYISVSLAPDHPEAELASPPTLDIDIPLARPNQPWLFPRLCTHFVRLLLVTQSHGAITYAFDDAGGRVGLECHYPPGREDAGRVGALTLHGYGSTGLNFGGCLPQAVDTSVPDQVFWLG